LGPVELLPSLGGRALFLYALSIFLGAFLLFLVQPMMAQFILPWFGGSSLVWTTCMLFFQSGLVLGYAYSHRVTQASSPWTQWILQIILVSAAILFLPIRPGLQWKPVDGLWPTVRVLCLLAATIGLPYVVLSTTGPLLQRWQSLSHPDRSPYRLFALSNLGSLLALLGFPFCLESYLTLDQQSWLWSGGFGVYAVAVVLCGYRYQALATPRAGQVDYRIVPNGGSASSGAGPTQSRFQRSLWFLLPMLASVQLLATTSFLTQEVGSHPFLWILPLALYLISFIICFEREQLYWRPFFFLCLCGSAIYACLIMEQGISAGFITQVIAYNGVLFSAAMICHGELARLKPTTQHLTAYYLWISLGGAAGGVLVAIVAPLCLSDYYEFHLSLILIVVCTMPMLVQQAWQQFAQQPKPLGKLIGSWLSITGGVVAASGVVAAGTMMIRDHWRPSVVGAYRNDYGVLRVVDTGTSRTLRHGNTMHGFQLAAAEWKNRPTSYYSPGSGLGLAIRFLQGSLGALADRPAGQPGETSVSPGPPKQGIRIAVIGLGTGTMAAWGRAGDQIQFFEIDPKVVHVARTHFTYLTDTPALSQVTLGDARIQLERECQAEAPRYDLLVADAFSSDSIPKHLLTTEAIRVYMDRIVPEGIVAIHVSNRFLDLAPLLQRQAEDIGVAALHISYSPDPEDPEDAHQDASTWVLLTRNPQFQLHPVVQSAVTRFPSQNTEIRWTDDFTPLLPILR
jgi:hypothetical protein